MGVEPPNQKVGDNIHLALEQVCPFLIIMHYIYILKSVHIHKILKQSFKQQINYNYFLSK